MTNLTLMLLQRDDVYGSSYGPTEGKFGLYVGFMDESPSESPRPRTLLTSEPIYETAEAAKAAAEDVIAKARQAAH
jgi:hypothetical protein